MFIVVTPFPGDKRVAFRKQDIVSVIEDREGVKLLTDDPNEPHVVFARESFDNVMGQLNHVD